MRALLPLAALICLPQLGLAQCRMAVAGNACVTAPQTAQKPPVEIGDVLERGQYLMLMNARYYGLPAVSDGWVYLHIEDDIYRVDWQTHTVLQRVTDQANANW